MARRCQSGPLSRGFLIRGWSGRTTRRGNDDTHPPMSRRTTSLWTSSFRRQMYACFWFEVATRNLRPTQRNGWITMQLHIDEAACTGHGRCYAVDPEQFDADEEGFGKVRDFDISAERARAALRI